PRGVVGPVGVLLAHGGHALAHACPAHSLGGGPVGQRSPGGGELLFHRFALQPAREDAYLGDLLLGDGQPAAQLVTELGLHADGVGHVQQGGGRGHRDVAGAGAHVLEGGGGRIQVGAPHVVPVDHTGEHLHPVFGGGFEPGRGGAADQVDA